MTAVNNIKKIKCDFSDVNLYNRVYIPLFENKSEFIHLFGSAGSGKSRFEAQKEIVLSFDWNRRSRKTLVVRYVATTLKDSVYAELKTVIYEWNLREHFEILKSPLQITNLLTGVVFIFIGLDDIEKVKSISGVDRIWVEEATELKRRSELDQLRLRLRGFEQVQITLSYNPIDEHHWLNKEIHELRPEGHFILKTTYRDNEKLLALDPNYAKSIESLEHTNPNYYRVYGLGLWGVVVEGLIYETYEIIDDFPKDESGNDDIQFYGLDFGYSDPTALVAMHVEDASPKKKLITKEILYKSGLDGVGLVAEFDKLKIRKDVWIIADGARPEMIATLKAAGYKVKAAEKGAGSVLTGINRVRKYRICIVAGSKNGIKEIQNYQKKEVNGIWFEEPAPNQVEHYWDAVRYGEQAVGVQTSGFSEIDFKIL
jgi:phage terminase large subunit